MAWFRIRLTEDRQHVVNEERSVHPYAHVQERMLALWLSHIGLTRENAARIVGISRTTIQRYIARLWRGGLEGLRRWDPSRPVSEISSFHELLHESSEKELVRTVAEACERIYQLTGLRRGSTQVWKSLKTWG